MCLKLNLQTSLTRYFTKYTDSSLKVVHYIYLNCVAAGVEVRSLDMKRLIGNGILHTKMWLVDGKHFYVGSANLDWRSYTQVLQINQSISQTSYKYS